MVLKIHPKGGACMCIGNSDPCQDELLRVKEITKLKKYHQYPSPEPRQPGDPELKSREQLPAEMPPDDPTFFEHILF